MASSILNPFSLCGLASRSAASAALRKFASVGGLADERGFGLGRSPGFGAHAAQRDARPRHVSAGDRDHDRRRRQGEFVRRPVAQLQIDLLASGDGRRKRDVRDQVARLEHRFALRRVAGQKMKVADRDRARALRSLHVDRRFQRRHRHAHVRRVGRDAMFARAEDGERAVAAGDGRAAGPGLALVAGHRGVAEIHAARSLEQVAGSRRHVAKLRRCAGEKGLRQHRIISLHRRMVGEIRIANRGADLQPAVRRRFDLVERQTVDVEEPRGRFDVQLHQIDQRRPAGEEAHVRALLRGLRLRGRRDRRRGICRPSEFESLHGDGSCSRLRPSANLLDRGHDIGIGAAAADVAAHQFLHGRVVGTARFLEQRNRRHDLAGRAISALVSVAGDECRLHRMQCVGRAEALDGRDLVPVVHQGQAQAGIHAPAIHVHRARAALAVITALLRSGESNGLAEAIEQRRSRIDAKLVLLAIDAQRDWHGANIIDLRQIGG